MNQLPLRDTDAALMVNWFELVEIEKLILKGNKNLKIAG